MTRLWLCVLLWRMGWGGRKISWTATIGTRPFTFVRDEHRRPRRKSIRSSVRLGRGVEIDAHANVDRGTERDTVIGDYSVLDHYVHFGHDAICGEGVIICAQAFIGGFVEIGDRAYLGAQCAIKPRVKIGADAQIGMGAIVVEDVPPGAVVRGSDRARISRWKPGFEPEGWSDPRNLYRDWR